MAKLPHLTRCGLPGIELVPYGMHACHFYRDREELVDALRPYFAEGLRNRERCLWITAPPLPANGALEALKVGFDAVDEAVATGALRVLDYNQWYEGAGGLKGVDVVQFWLDEEERALAEGCNGLRIAGNMSFLKPDDWATFIEYEHAVTAHFNGRRIVALCSYPASLAEGQQENEVLEAHHCGFERPGETWQVSAEAKPLRV